MGDQERESWSFRAGLAAWFHLPPCTPAHLPEMGPRMPAPHLLVTLALLGLPHTTLALGLLPPSAPGY